MEIDELLAAVAARGVDLVRYCHRVSTTSARAADELVDRFGINRATAGRWLNLAAALFGPLKDRAEKRRRDRAVLRAEELGLSIDALLTINTALRYLEPKAPATHEQARLQLTESAEGLTVDALKASANAQIRELNEGVESTPAPKRRYFRTSRTADARGMRYAHLCLPEADMAALERILHKRATKLRKHDEELTHQQAMADALTDHAGSDRAGSDWLQPAILITMDDLEHRGDSTYATTDGNLITPAEYADQQLAPYGLCLVYDNTAEPIDLFRIRRTASDKQRAILSLDQLLCADPNCTHTATNSQAHHIFAYKHGGFTNVEDMVAACASHNARNDDDPGVRRNGRLERCPTTGQAGWRPPDGGPLRFNRYPIVAKSGRVWAASRVLK